MKVRSLCFTLSILILSLSGSALSRSKTAKGEDSITAPTESKSLAEKARIKKELFYWQLRLTGDVPFAAKKIEKLHLDRLRIQKSIERLEFLAKVKRVKNKNALAKSDSDQDERLSFED
ncbi:MAG: hypothetical protein ACE5HO_12580 [bacterium]